MSLGSVISASRNAAGMSVEKLAEETSIRPGLLREMEKDNFLNCGGETYARGHLRNIATKLKVDPDVFLSLYIEEQSVVERKIQDLLTETNVMRSSKEKSNISWKTLASISLSCIVIAGVAQVVISNSKTSTPVASKSIASPTPSISTPTASASPTPSATIASTMTGAITVSLQAKDGKSWIFANDSTGHTLFSGQIFDGESRDIASDSPISIRIGNAGAIDLTVNGKKVGQIGAAGQVVNVTYDKNS